MKIANLTENSTVYTSNVYLVTGTWNAMDDVNTLIDVGRDASVIDRIYDASTGVGKRKLDQVILTHSHYDHTSLLPRIREIFNPKVHAFSKYLEGVDTVLKGGERLKVGDRMAEVIHTPGHSQDSICIYVEEEGILFAGDTPLIIQSIGGTYEEDFIGALERICMLDISSIYFGHGEPLLHDCNTFLSKSLKNVRMSCI